MVIESRKAAYVQHAWFDKWCLIGFLFCSAFLLVRLLSHALWRDEAQAWLIAVHAQSLADLIVVRNEGHPPLHYWLLYALSAVGQQLWMVKIPQGLFAIGTLGLVWFASPFSRLEKLLISLGYYLSFQYGILSRNYILGTFFCLLYVSYFGRLFSHAVLAALVLGLAALSHILFAFVASALSLPLLLLWWRHDTPLKRLILFCVIFGGCALFSVISAKLSVSGELLNSYAGNAVFVSDFATSMIRQTTSAFLHGVPADKGILTIIVIGLLILFFQSAPLLGLVFLVGAAAVTTFLSLIYGGAPWHNGMIYILLISLYGIGYAKLHANWLSRSAILCLLTLSVVGNLWELPRSFSIPYSAGEEAADLIRELGLTEAAWAAYSDQTATVTFAELERPVFGLKCGCTYTFVDWSIYRIPDRSLEENLKIFIEGEPSGVTYVLISRHNLEQVLGIIDGTYSYEQLAETGPSRIHNEAFVILKVAQL